MAKKLKVGIIGLGRIATGCAYYFKRSPQVSSVFFVRADAEAQKADLLVGALAGGIGSRCLELALKHRKNLLDLSDVDPPGYLKKKNQIEKAGITVIPGCGFSPGLTNFILGRELGMLSGVRSVEIKAGSLSKKKHYYPFLWCFEDIVVEHTIPSYQLIGKTKKKFPAFDGYQKERFFGIEAESYLCASGFENVLDKAGVENCFCRVVRPVGFRDFFRFLESYCLLEKSTLATTKALLERVREDNYTLAEISFSSPRQQIIWRMRSFSRKDDTLNSMQKITSSVPAVVAEILLCGLIKQTGLLFMEELGKDAGIFNALIGGLRRQGIRLSRSRV